MIWLQHTIVFLLAIAGPIWDYFAFKRLKADPSTHAKVNFYIRAIALQWIFSALIFFCVGRSIYWAPPAFAWMGLLASKIAAIACAAGILIGLIAPFFALRKPKARATIRKAFSKLDYFVPTRPGEFFWFGALCVTAGICEEWLARGFLFRYFGQTPWHWGLTAAFIIASGIFGVNHLYQGLAGALAATTTGVVMGLLYLWTGNLLVPMITHALIDLRALFLLKAVHIEQPAADTSTTSN